MWSAKEAVLKALGTGLALSPHDVQITAIGPDDASVVLHGAAAALHEELGGGRIAVRWGTAASDEVMVTVRLAA